MFRCRLTARLKCGTFSSFINVFISTYRNSAHEGANKCDSCGTENHKRNAFNSPIPRATANAALSPSPDTL